MSRTGPATVHFVRVATELSIIVPMLYAALWQVGSHFSWKSSYVKRRKPFSEFRLLKKERIGKKSVFPAIICHYL
jgi:hypothetical protein